MPPGLVLQGTSLVCHCGGAQKSYDDMHREAINAVVLRNRSDGPFGLLSIIDERCGGEFDNIDDIVPAAERQTFMANYKAAAGLARDALNTAAPIIP